MPGRFFQPSISDRFSGLSSGKLPRMPKRLGYLAAASSEILPEFGSQPGGCNRQALTPAASMSRMHSSAVYEGTWRCDGLVGGPADQMWTCASTVNIAGFMLLNTGRFSIWQFSADPVSCRTRRAQLQVAALGPRQFLVEHVTNAPDGVPCDQIWTWSIDDQHGGPLAASAPRRSCYAIPRAFG